MGVVQSERQAAGNGVHMTKRCNQTA